jgi:hypothetical protein
VRAWAASRGHDYLLTDDSAFDLCGADYLARVGDNPRSKTNLCRLELIARAHADGYDLAIWMDADIFVFSPEHLVLEAAEGIVFARETWLWPRGEGWEIIKTLNNCVVACPSGDKDLGFIIQTIRHVAAHHRIDHNFRVGVDLIRGLHRFLQFELTSSVGMFSNHTVVALARQREGLLKLQAVHHGAPVYAANLCATDHMTPVVPERDAHKAMDILEATRGEIINGHLTTSSSGK